jgi:hypothetical protein
LVQSFFCQPFSVHFASLLTGRTVALATGGGGRENQLGPKSSQKVPISEYQCRDRGEKSEGREWPCGGIELSQLHLMEEEANSLKDNHQLGTTKITRWQLYFYCIPKTHQYQMHQIIIIAIFASSQLKRRRARLVGRMEALHYNL